MCVCVCECVCERVRERERERERDCSKEAEKLRIKRKNCVILNKELFKLKSFLRSTLVLRPVVAERQC